MGERPKGPDQAEEEARPVKDKGKDRPTHDGSVRHDGSITHGSDDPE